MSSTRSSVHSLADVTSGAESSLQAFTDGTSDMNTFTKGTITHRIVRSTSPVRPVTTTHRQQDINGMSSLISGDKVGITETTYVSNTTDAEPGMSSVSLAGIVLAGAFVVGTAVAIIVIMYCRRKRKRSENSKVRVWQENSVHALPDLTKPRTTWHDGDVESGPVASDFNPDLEFQPANIFRGSSNFESSYVDSTVFGDLTEMVSQPNHDKQRAVSEDNNESIKTGDKEETNKEYLKHKYGLPAHENIESASEVQRESVQYAQVQKKQKSFKIVESESDANSASVKDETDKIGCDEYVTMTVDEHCVVKYDEGEEDDIYNNSEIIRRVQSVNSSSGNSSKNHPPKRAVSEMGKTEAKPPKALPRMSVKKVNNDDKSSRDSMTENQVDDFMTQALPPGYDYVDESNFIANRERKAKEEIEETIYDVPQKRVTDSDSECDGTDEESSDTEDNIYDVPRMRNTQNSDEDQ